MSKKVKTHLDFGKNQIQNVVVYPLASDPNTAGWGAAEKGIPWFNTTDDVFKYWDGSAIQTIPTLAALNAALEGLAWKDEVVAATTANITIASDLNVADTIDGITLADGDRVLVKDQTSQDENGIYIAGASPARAADMSASAEFNAAIVPVQLGGTDNGGTNFRCKTVDPVVDTDNIEFENFGASIPDASETIKGKIELATVAESEGKADTVRAVTPAGLATFTRKYAADISSSSGEMSAEGRL